MMKKAVKITLISAGAVMMTGVVISAAAISMGAGKADSGVSQRTETITDKISSVSINVNYDDIDIIQRDIDNIRVLCSENEKKKYNISSDNGILTIASSDNKRKFKWYEYINLDFFNDDDLHKIVIETPRDFEVDMIIKNSYGDINVTGVNGSLNASLDSGDIEIENCVFTSLDCMADYGDIEIKHTSAQNITADNDCGDIYFEEAVGNIRASCEFGDIEFEYISGDNLIFNDSCGDIEGVIRGKKAEYEPGGTKKIEANSDMGRVDVRFTE